MDKCPHLLKNPDGYVNCCDLKVEHCCHYIENFKNCPIYKLLSEVSRLKKEIEALEKWRKQWKTSAEEWMKIAQRGLRGEKQFSTDSKIMSLLKKLGEIYFEAHEYEKGKYFITLNDVEDNWWGEGENISKVITKALEELRN